MFRYLSLLVAAALAMTTSAFAEGREPVMKQVKVPHNYYWREMYVPHLTSGPSSLDWTADGKSLVYSMQGRLWRQRVGDDTARQLTTGGGYDYQPDVSADGRRVVFTRYFDDAYEIVIRDLRSGRETPVTQNGAVNLDPRWSPDGTQIAYVTTDETGHFHIAIASQENGAWTSKRWREERTSETPRYYYSQIDHELSPAWSPDGQSLTFIANPEIGYGSGAVYRQRVDKSAPAEMLVNEETAWRARPDWSPDGNRIAYSSFERRQSHQLWITYAEPGGYPLAFSYGDYDIDAARWSPDSKHIAYISNESGTGEIVIQDMTGGARETLAIQDKNTAQGMGDLQLRIVDETGAPAPARISIRGGDGRYYAPDGAMIHADDYYDRAQAPSETMYFHVQGEATISLPAGEAQITAWRGFRHAVATTTATIAKDKTSDESITLQPLPNAAAFDGWRSADVHVHMNYGGVYGMTPARLAKQADAEDLDLVFNLIVNKEQRIPDMDYFTPEPFNPEGTGATILHAQEYHTSLWGHMGLLGLKEHYLLGDYVAYPKTALHSSYPDNPTVADIAHAQGALVGYVHPFDPPAPDPSSNRKLSHALPVNAALGKLDYLEIVGFADPLTTESVWHKLLNTGLRIPAAGGTDAMTDYSSLRGPLGQNRTLVKAADSENPNDEVANWLAALKAGNSIATNGPLVMLTLDGAGPGADLKKGKGAHTLNFKAVLSSIAPVDSLDLIVNGEVAQTIALSGDRTSASFEGAVTINESAWVTLRAYSKTASPYVLDNSPFATTSPIYVTLGGKPVRSRDDAEHFIAWIDKLIHVAEDGSYNTDEERAAVIANLKKARLEFEKRR
ncbi:CehA/McbA family metallohydrolase [Marinicaulis aureus]|uniref:CehA/McbA family metallohydrolase n=1 Tax=Hyphococcus aureus TaxID=2666033 RepID=A0ABW1KW71_9PROT